MQSVTIAYDQAFYSAYLRYLAEPVVRRNHDEMFEFFRRWTGPCSLQVGPWLSVVDLGCGLGEFERHGDWRRYVGVDRNDTGKVKDFIHGDYSDLAGVKALLRWEPDAFVSLFSIEACFLPDERYTLYDRVFDAWPSIRFGMVSGFYYQNRLDEPVVSEAGGAIVSCQTIEKQADFLSSRFFEVRTSLRTPSELFGDDVVEVWKFFARRA
jgi:SAM-dependent methyltransferase